MPSGHGKTRRAIVKLLKSDGPLNSARLARRLALTAMAVRQHLYALEREKLVTSEERPVPLGRPAKYWRLTRDADRLFPDAYAELSVALLGAMDDAFGPGGVQRVLDSRLARQRAEYAARIPAAGSLQAKLRELARIRTEEGYMADVRRDGDAYLFIEKHCPICAAANACQGFCATELDLFRSVLGRGVLVERTEHILAGEARCAYRISPSRRPE
jgi:predicted ArsR family transcriptional regulator